MKPVDYRKPRVINPVSVTLVAVLLAGGYAGYELVRVEFQRQEVFRVLEETGSTFAGKHSLYEKDAKQRELLRSRMQSQVVALGISDPELETWVDAAPGQAQLGVVYTASYHWPFDAFAPIAREIQLEHDVVPTQR
ncbi:MAG: hypothetical protein IAG13_16915 [Deltaproteobacteria bacterium]|nr:hypothetical protein [Nannocystaceae bacterium]